MRLAKGALVRMMAENTRAARPVGEGLVLLVERKLRRLARAGRALPKTKLAMRLGIARDTLYRVLGGGRATERVTRALRAWVRAA